MTSPIGRERSKAGSSSRVRRSLWVRMPIGFLSASTTTMQPTWSSAICCRAARVTVSAVTETGSRLINWPSGVVMVCCSAARCENWICNC